jgi:hypothetical protein
VLQAATTGWNEVNAPYFQVPQAESAYYSSQLNSRYSDGQRAGFDFRRGKIFLSSTVSRLALRPTQSPIEWVPGAISSGVKRPGRETDRSPLFSAGVKKGGAKSPLSLVQGVLLSV